MLIDAWDEHLSYPELRSRVIKDWSTEYGGTTVKDGLRTARRADRILVEAKASGQSLLQDLRLAKVPAIGYNPGNADKISRAHQASPTLEMGFLWLPESGKNRGQPVSWAQAFLKQLAKFPVAEHDDYVDTFSQAVIYLKNEGWFDLPQARERDEPRQYKRERVNPYAV
jgi:predicted phage terminase large subunit-like protein